MDVCSWGPLKTSFLKPQEPFKGFKQCVGGQFSAMMLSEFQYLLPLTNFLDLWVFVVDTDQFLVWSCNSIPLLSYFLG